MTDAPAGGPVLRVGLTLPQFHDDPDVLARVARAAEAAGVDGVFAYDHVFRVARGGERRPAIEMSTVLGLLAAETDRITVGTLVARASLRPVDTLVAILTSAHRATGGRFVAGLGTGDGESRPEHTAYGVPFASLPERVARLEATVRAGAEHGFPTWVGGRHPDVLAVAGRWADGWNRWAGNVEEFAAELAVVRAAAEAAGRPHPVATWGGLVVLAASDAAAAEAAARRGAGPGVLVGSPATVAGLLGPWVHAGAAWLVLGPLDATDPANAALAVEVREHLVGAA